MSNSVTTLWFLHTLWFRHTSWFCHTFYFNAVLIVPWWPKARLWWPKARPWRPKRRPWWPKGRPSWQKNNLDHDQGITVVTSGGGGHPKPGGRGRRQGAGPLSLGRIQMPYQLSISVKRQRNKTFYHKSYTCNAPKNLVILLRSPLNFPNLGVSF